MTAAVTILGCQGCGACLLTCPEHAIRPDTSLRIQTGSRGGILLVRDDLCSGCGECVEVCPVDAIAFAPEVAGPAIPGGDLS